MVSIILKPFTWSTAGALRNHKNVNRKCEVWVFSFKMRECPLVVQPHSHPTPKTPAKEPQNSLKMMILMLNLFQESRGDKHVFLLVCGRIVDGLLISSSLLRCPLSKPSSESLMIDRGQEAWTKCIRTTVQAEREVGPFSGAPTESTWDPGRRVDRGLVGCRAGGPWPGPWLACRCAPSAVVLGRWPWRAHTPSCVPELWDLPSLNGSGGVSGVCTALVFFTGSHQGKPFILFESLCVF